LRKSIILILTVALLLTFVPTAFVANTPQTCAADKLHILGLLARVNTKPDGTTNYSLDSTLTWESAVTLIVNILG
jgi:hypothetical protein